MTLSHETLQELLAGYALHALSGDEAREVEVHLPTCADCRHILADYERVGDELARLVPVRTAPSHLEADLRSRLVAARKERGGAERPPRLAFLSGWRPIALAAAFALALGLGLWLVVGGPAPGLGDAQLAEAILSSDEAVRVALVPDDIAPDVNGEVVLGEDANALVVVVNDLPALEEDQVYQLWLIEDGRRDNGGTYWYDEQVWVARAPRALNRYDAIGVTIEPQGGSPAPTGPRVLSAALPSDF